MRFTEHGTLKHLKCLCCLPSKSLFFNVTEIRKTKPHCLSLENGTWGFQTVDCGNNKSQILPCWVTQTDTCNKYLEWRGNIHLDLDGGLREPYLFNLQVFTLPKIHTTPMGHQGQQC